MRLQVGSVAVVAVGLHSSFHAVESLNHPSCAPNIGSRGSGHSTGKSRTHFRSDSRIASAGSTQLRLLKQWDRSNSVQLLVAQGDGDMGPSSDHDRALGISVLLTVPMAWGTFEPAVRYIYTIEPSVPGFVFSVAYYLVAAVSLSLLVMVSSRNQVPHDTHGLNIDMTGNEQISKFGTTSLPIRGGLELGFYLFLGNGLQVLGLESTPSDRAAFLLQLTTIFVPFVQAAIARDLLAIPLRTWGACVVALMGVAVMGLDGRTEVIQNGSIFSAFLSSFESLSSGDLLIILAAFSYTFHCIRLGRIAKETSALKLAACKAATETALSLCLVFSLVSISQGGLCGDGLWDYACQEGGEISSFVTTFSESVSSGTLTATTLLPAVGAVLWTGLVTVAYTIYAQSFGQSRVNATDANLIYTIQPLFTAVVAWVLLGEKVGPAGYAGGALIGAAVYLVASDVSKNEKDSDSGTADEGVA